MYASGRNNITISVIIPTTCELHRWASLQRAIGTATTQENVDVSVIVVVNGEHFSPECLEQLRRMPQLTVLYMLQGSAPLAQRLGRLAVHTEFFSFLDDDDEYLPGGLWARVQPMLGAPDTGFVASNGYRMVEGKQELAVQQTDALLADPLFALCDENWMSSCGGLFRSASVTTDYFDDPAPYLEWTFLAYRLALELPMAWVAQPTFRIHDTPGSLSKSETYRCAETDVLRRIAALRLPPHVGSAIKEKIGRAYHELSHDNMVLGRAGQACRFHMMSLRQPGGWRYLLYSRKVLAVWLRAPFAMR